MSYGWVHRKNIIVTMTEAMEDSLLETVRGKEFVAKGDYVCTNIDNEQLIFPSEYVEQMSQIKVTPSTRQKKDSPFVSEYMKQLQEMPELLQDESNLWGK